MSEIDQMQDWFEGLEGLVTVQKTKTGQWFMAITKGSVSVSVTRPTFSEAARECVSAVRTTDKKLKG